MVLSIWTPPSPVRGERRRAETDSHRGQARNAISGEHGRVVVYGRLRLARGQLGLGRQRPLRSRPGLREPISELRDLIFQLEDQVDELHQDFVGVHLPLGAEVVEQSPEVLSSLLVLHRLDRSRRCMRAHT